VLCGAAMTRLANAVFRASLAVFRGQGRRARWPLLHPWQAAGVGPPWGAETKRDACVVVAPGGASWGPLKCSP
jgi:hypothetical protein